MTSRRKLTGTRNSPSPGEWAWRSAAAGIATFVNLTALGACSGGSAPSIDADGVRYLVLGMLALTGVILICLALGLRIPIPKAQGVAYLGPITARSGRISAGSFGLVLVAVCVAAILMLSPSRIPDPAPIQPPGEPPRPPSPPVRELTLTVTDADEVDRRVLAEVYLIDGTDTAERLGETNENGRFTLQQQLCVAGVQIEVRPREQYGALTLNCPIEDGADIRVTRTLFLDNLRWNAAAATQACRYDLAPFVYSEILARVSGAEADEAQMAIYELAAMAEEMGFDHTQPVADGEGRISSAFSDTIRSFQRTHGLADSGRLDYVTLARLSNDPIWPYLRRRPRIQSVCVD